MPDRPMSCPSCGDERSFETPPCVDGHGPECAELACRDCGAALLVPLTVELRVPRPRPHRHALGAAA